ncbi:DUF4139 domain-containing protein [Candidatus Poribacteria bacterium]|nr:DUF4139 domain-containing protein [Candidatus Poribacteria bacterium]
MRTCRPRRWSVIAATAAIALVASTSVSQVQLTTLPKPGRVGIDIYGAGIALVTQSRSVRLHKGSNTVQFRWSGSEIDRFSLLLRPAPGVTGVSVGSATFPSGQQNAIQWDVHADADREADMEVAFYASGFGWSTHYMAWVSDDDSQTRLVSWFSVTNASGEDFEGAEIRLVVGVLQTVPEARPEALADATKAAPYAGRQLRKADRSAGIALAAEDLGEHHVFSLTQPADIKNGGTSALPALSAAGVPVRLVHRWNGGEVRAEYTFINDAKHKVGDSPLPAGPVTVLRRTSDGTVSFVGSAQMDYIPIGKEIRLDVGPDKDIVVERTIQEWRRTNFRFTESGDLAAADIETAFRFDVTNHGSRPIDLLIPETISGRWELLDTDTSHERKGVREIEFRVRVEPTTSRQINYRIRQMAD